MNCIARTPISVDLTVFIEYRLVNAGAERFKGATETSQKEAYIWNFIQVKLFE